MLAVAAKTANGSSITATRLLRRRKRRNFCSFLHPPTGLADGLARLRRPKRTACAVLRTDHRPIRPCHERIEWLWVPRSPRTFRGDSAVVFHNSWRRRGYVSVLHVCVIPVTESPVLERCVHMRGRRLS